MAKIKYMGMSHVHRLEAGDDFGGRLAKPLAKDVVFDESNRWVIDTNDSGLSRPAIEILLDDPDFLDVSDLEKIPVNKHQETFKGLTDRAVLADEVVEDDDDSTYTAPDVPDSPQPEEAEGKKSKKG